jgi:hypothetical protein
VSPLLDGTVPLPCPSSLIPVRRVPPPGIDAYMTNGGGEYMAPQFDTKGVSDLAPYHMPDGGWTGNRSDYTTSVVGNMSLAWLKKVAAGPRPFFAYIAPKACVSQPVQPCDAHVAIMAELLHVTHPIPSQSQHEPFTPAPWYADFWDPSWPATEPRPISWNASFESRKNHHGEAIPFPAWPLCDWRTSTCS